jgi:hypothetical protein
LVDPVENVLLTARFVVLWTASEDFLLLLSESVCQKVNLTCTNILNTFERKDPSVRFSATMTSILLTLT